jgi:hypothetical protein
MQRVLGIPRSQMASTQTGATPAEPVVKGEVRWIERLQQRPLSPLATSIAVDAPESGLWIKRLQQRAGGREL